MASQEPHRAYRQQALTCPCALMCQVFHCPLNALAISQKSPTQRIHHVTHCSHTRVACPARCLWPGCNITRGNENAGARTEGRQSMRDQQWMAAGSSSSKGYIRDTGSARQAGGLRLLGWVQHHQTPRNHWTSHCM
jgi:hypothetical protein